MLGGKACESRPMLITSEQLIGTWRLMQATATDADGNALAAPYGPRPMGRLVLEANGRMIAALCDGRTEMPHGQERAYSSYCGQYRVENNQLITTVDGAAISQRVGGQEVRSLEFRGADLVLIPPRRADGSQRELYWRFDGPP
jgi:hypothetical protein